MRSRPTAMSRVLISVPVLPANNLFVKGIRMQPRYAASSPWAQTTSSPTSG
jgi:hypothetical protein